MDVQRNQTFDERGDSKSTVRIRELLPQDKMGIDSIPYQLVKKRVQDGFVFNILLVGETGIGKSTLISSLFNIPTLPPSVSHRNPGLTLKFRKYELSEKGVNLTLNAIETVGFGDQVNRGDNVQPIVEYINSQFEAYLQEELKVKRNWLLFKDTRVHACLYLVCPTVHGLKDIDLVCMRQLQDLVNVIPVIAKADCLTKPEVQLFKRAIRRDLVQAGIEVYRCPDDEDSAEVMTLQSNELVPMLIIKRDPDNPADLFREEVGETNENNAAQKIFGQQIQGETHFKRELEIEAAAGPMGDVQDSSNLVRNRKTMPLAVSASTDFVSVLGRRVRGRKFPWGTMLVEDEDHSEFLALQDMLVGTHTVDLVERTHELHYERFRRRRLAELGLSEFPLEELARRRQQLDEELRADEDRLAERAVGKTRDMERQFKERERSLRKEFEKEFRKLEKQMADLLEEKSDLDYELRRLMKKKSVLSIYEA